MTSNSYFLPTTHSIVGAPSIRKERRKEGKERVSRQVQASLICELDAEGWSREKRKREWGKG